MTDKFTPVFALMLTRDELGWLDRWLGAGAAPIEPEGARVTSKVAEKLDMIARTPQMVGIHPGK